MSESDTRIIEDHDGDILDGDTMCLSSLVDDELRSRGRDMTRARDVDDTFNHWQDR